LDFDLAEVDRNLVDHDERRLAAAQLADRLGAGATCFLSLFSTRP
jgi:hypothetical protein